MSDRKLYRGQQINVSFDGRRCIHVAHCVRSLPAVFDEERRPWIKVDQAQAAEVAAVVAGCPSGALRVESERERPAARKTEANVVIPEPDGPLFVQGELSVHDAEGRSIEEQRVALCRCGASNNKPFCDNSHNRRKFRSQRIGVSEIVQSPAEALAGRLRIKMRAKGPYLLRGNFEIHTAGGDVVFRGQRAALCRCGASKNMPFCDSSHREIRLDGPGSEPVQQKTE